MIHLWYFWIVTCLVVKVLWVKEWRIWERFIGGLMIISLSIRTTLSMTMITNLVLVIWTSELIYLMKSLRLKLKGKTMHIYRNTTNYWHIRIITQYCADLKKGIYILIQPTSMMITQMCMIVLKRKEFQLGVIEFYLRKMKIVKEN